MGCRSSWAVRPINRVIDKPAGDFRNWSCHFSEWIGGHVYAWPKSFENGSFAWVQIRSMDSDRLALSACLRHHGMGSFVVGMSDTRLCFGLGRSFDQAGLAQLFFVKLCQGQAERIADRLGTPVGNLADSPLSTPAPGSDLDLGQALR